MLEKSKASTAPMSERSSSALSLASRSSRRRSKSTRASQSTALVPVVPVVFMSRLSRSWQHPVSDEDHAAFDGDDLTGDVVRIGRGEEHAGRHDVVRVCGTAEQDAARHGVEAVLSFADLLELAVEL